MKPIIRWTIGNIHPLGFKIFRSAVDSFRDIYQDIFDYVIVYNSLVQEQIDEIGSLSVPLLEATYNNEIKYPPQDSKWKLYPQRIRQESHEIVLDNDVIWFKRLPAIDHFLNSSKFLVCDGRHRNLGHYDSCVPKGLKLNSGIVGYPPGFNLSQAIHNVIDKEPYKLWRHWNDDQGILATIILNTKNYTQITLDEVSISYPEFVPANYGTHFCGSNKGYSKAYNQFTNVGSLML